MTSFAANMGDSTQITPDYKPRIAPAEPSSFFTSFVYGDSHNYMAGRSVPAE